LDEYCNLIPEIDANGVFSFNEVYGENWDRETMLEYEPAMKISAKLEHLTGVPRIVDMWTDSFKLFLDQITRNL
jgi:hypothetical protein